MPSSKPTDQSKASTGTIRPPKNLVPCTLDWDKPQMPQSNASLNPISRSKSSIAPDDVIKKQKKDSCCRTLWPVWRHKKQKMLHAAMYQCVLSDALPECPRPNQKPRSGPMTSPKNKKCFISSYTFDWTKSNNSLPITCLDRAPWCRQNVTVL